MLFFNSTIADIICLVHCNKKCRYIFISLCVFYALGRRLRMGITFFIVTHRKVFLKQCARMWWSNSLPLRLSCSSWGGQCDHDEENANIDGSLECASIFYSRCNTRTYVISISISIPISIYLLIKQGDILGFVLHMWFCIYARWY